MKTIQQIARECLHLACIPQAHIASIDVSPVLCHDPDEKPYYHRTSNAIAWSTGEGDTLRTGLVALNGRVTEFVGGNQIVKPFGGKFESSAESLYRFVTWDCFNAHP